MARKDQLEQPADEARAVLAERRVFLDSADIIANFAADMSEFLRTSDITESKAFMCSFVKEITVRPRQAVMSYTISASDDSPIGHVDAAGVALKEQARSTAHGGRKWWTHAESNRLSVSRSKVYPIHT